MKKYIIPFQEITPHQRERVGEKNFSVAELIKHFSPMGINVPDGFAITSDAYVDFLQSNCLFPILQVALNDINRLTFENIGEISKHCRESIMRGSFPEAMENEIKKAYSELINRNETSSTVAVRSSGTTRYGTIPDFNGQYDTLLNVDGPEQVMNAIKKCYSSMFSERALRYRFDECCSDLLSGISVGIQFMVRSDKGSSGIAFTFGTHSKNEKLIYITGSLGLGQGNEHTRVNADEFYLSKSALKSGNPCIVLNVRGLKEEMLVAGTLESTTWIKTPDIQKHLPVLTDSELELLGLWSLAIEKHYAQPVDIEWAKDGIDNKLYVVQARVQKTTNALVRADGTSAIPTVETPLPPGDNLLFRYQLEELGMLHKESNEWLQQISFMKDEILFMQKLVSSVLQLSLSPAKTGHFKTELTQLNDLHIHLLYHQIIEHETWLSDIFQTDTMGRHVSYKEIHAELSVKMAKYYRIFLELRHDVLMLANSYLKTNVRMHSEN